MNFMLAKGGWRVSFLEEDCKTVLRRHLVFQDEAKILDMAMRGGAESSTSPAARRSSMGSG